MNSYPKQTHGETERRPALIGLSEFRRAVRQRFRSGQATNLEPIDLSVRLECSALIKIIAEPRCFRSPRPDDDQVPGTRSGVSFSPKRRPLAVLVVEDDVLVRLIAIDMLDEAGFRTIEARDAQEAMVLLEAHAEVQVLFTDWNMPGEIDGLGLARLVRRRWPDVGIIVTSGKMLPQPGDLPAGARFIKKPYRASVLIQEVENFLSGHSEAEPGAAVTPAGLVAHRPSSHAAGGADIAGPPPEADKT